MLQNQSLNVTKSINLCYKIYQFMLQNQSINVTKSIDLCHKINLFMLQNQSINVTKSIYLCHKINQFMSQNQSINVTKSINNLSSFVTSYYNIFRPVNCRSEVIQLKKIPSQNNLSREYRVVVLSDCVHIHQRL